MFIWLVRENTEGEYSVIEYVIADSVVQDIKLFSEEARRHPSRSVISNWYGNTLNDQAVGLNQGLGVTPSEKTSETEAIFESVIRTDPDIAGQDCSNPTALFSSAIMILCYMDLNKYADLIKSAVLATIREAKNLTADHDSRSTCS
ncbi:unnamed protein product [Schistosoma margrebowiei]|uniref:isocitrate dehydrogenase (NAD(+)) n=1 Tax=Schistosoma margrebowiei TaxID=48269 RepID=A0AA84Z4P4_9TREM|nr:unnamed protein product [Schistosoma margrebowiei]